MSCVWFLCLAVPPMCCDAGWKGGIEEGGGSKSAEMEINREERVSRGIGYMIPFLFPRVSRSHHVPPTYLPAAPKSQPRRRLQTNIPTQSVRET